SFKWLGNQQFDKLRSVVHVNRREHNTYERNDDQHEVDQAKNSFGGAVFQIEHAHGNQQKKKCVGQYNTVSQNIQQYIFDDLVHRDDVCEAWCLRMILAITFDSLSSPVSCRSMSIFL